jgi:hypothetical protein
LKRDTLSPAKHDLIPVKCAAGATPIASEDLFPVNYVTVTTRAGLHARRRMSLEEEIPLWTDSPHPPFRVAS